MTSWARAERHALCDDLVTFGPDAATLCGDWSTRELAAHLILRERRPDAAVGIVVSKGPAGRWNRHVQSAIARQPWDRIVESVRSGPPWWSPTRVERLDDLVNTVEFFVHHEDVRRAQAGWEPRELDPAFEDALWQALGRLKLLVRKSPVGVVLARPDGRRLVAKQADHEVVVSGPPSELLLFCYGRGPQARVGFVGDDADIARLRATEFGV